MKDGMVKGEIGLLSSIFNIRKGSWVVRQLHKDLCSKSITQLFTFFGLDEY